MFIDRAKIFVKAGKGGNGCLSFRREKYVAMGGPDGANGGKGGDVYVQSFKRYKTLYDFTKKRHFVAGDGTNGGSGLKTGKIGSDFYIHVPCGTQVYKYDEDTKEKKFLADLVRDSDSVKVASGGRGGRGNASFKTGKRTAPRIAEHGEPGEEAAMIFELKLIAKLGLLGYPNAGKSTFLSRITAAKPKIADYPFTTLVPNLGVIEYYDSQYVIADIPGLIDGAHDGVGLGFDFLRHVERTSVLVHLVDVNGYNNVDAYKNFLAINKELELYKSELGSKRQIVLISKSDTADMADIEKLKKKILDNKKFKVLNVFYISSVTGQGLGGFLEFMHKELKELEATEPEPESVIRTEFSLEKDFVVEKEENIFYVKGKKIERLVNMTLLDESEALNRFQNIIKKIGLEKALIDAGIEEGDTVFIGKHSFCYKKN